MFGRRQSFGGQQEAAIIRREMLTGQSSEEIIKSQESRAHDALKSFKLFETLQKQGAFEMILSEEQAGIQIETAKEVIRQNPFLHRYVPDHLTEESEQAGFIVAVAKALKEDVGETIH